MYCGHCGNRIPEEAAFCNSCGSSVTSIPTASTATEDKPTPQLHEQIVAADLLQTQQPTVPAEQHFTVDGLILQSAPTLRHPTNTQSFPSLPGISGSFPISSGVAWTPTLQAPTVPPPQIPFSPNAMQRALIRIFQPALASNPWLGIILGSILSIVSGVLVSSFILVVVHAILAVNMHDLASAGYSLEDRESGLLGIYSVHAPFRDSLQLFLVTHGVGLHFQYATNSNSYTATSSSYAPLNGLLLLPALLLTFGGYLSACTDFQNRFTTSLWRGAAIALPYTVLLIILASQVNGPVIGVEGLTLNMDMLTVLLFGLLWGALFGMLGASLKFAQGQWRHMMYSFVRTNPRPQLLGSIAGGLAAIGLGLALTLLTLYSFVAFTFYSTPLLTSNACILTNWQSLTLWSIVQGPIHAANAFAFSFGAPLTLVNQGTGGSQSCFYTSTTHATLSMLDPTLHEHPWVYALLLIPALSLFIGGRASVAASGTRNTGPAAIQGALIALPFTIFMIILALLSVISNVSTYSSSSATNSTTSIQSASVNVFNMLLWALLSSAVFGSLGGIYQASPLKDGIRGIGSALALPFNIVCEPLYTLLDRLSGQPRSSRRSTGRTFLYAALLVSVLVGIASGIAGAYLISANQSLTLEDNQRIFNILSVLAIALPGVLLLCSAATTLSTDPLPSSPPNYTLAPTTLVQTQRGF